MKRSNHYDSAFAEYLRQHHRPHVAVDEHRRAVLWSGSLKSMDFIVHRRQPPHLLVDVKGRRFPAGKAGGHKWENWATRDDLESLSRWEAVFGGEFRGLLVFAYQVTDALSLRELQDPFPCRGRVYAFYGIWADDFRRGMRRRSARWDTVCLPRGRFRQLRRPVAEFLELNHPDEKAVFIPDKDGPGTLQQGELADPRLMRESTSRILADTMEQPAVE